MNWVLTRIQYLIDLVKPNKKKQEPAPLKQYVKPITAMKTKKPDEDKEIEVIYEQEPTQWDIMREKAGLPNVKQSQTLGQVIPSRYEKDTTDEDFIQLHKYVQLYETGFKNGSSSLPTFASMVKLYMNKLTKKGWFQHTPLHPVIRRAISIVSQFNRDNKIKE